MMSTTCSIGRGAGFWLSGPAFLVFFLLTISTSPRRRMVSRGMTRTTQTGINVLAGQVLRHRSTRLAHPQGRNLRTVLFGHVRRATEGRLAAVGSVIADQNLPEHN